ncbi:MAG: hypothetical protein ABF586_07835 [Sporolactobacillus sp.]
MLEEHAKVAELIRQAGGINGRRKLQKIIYILQKLGVPFYETFHFQMHGPYSEELSLQLEELCDFGFLTEAWSSESGQVTYSVTPSGEEFLAGRRTLLPDVSALAGQLAAEKNAFLELTAALFYFDTLPKTRVLEKVQSLYENMEQVQIDSAFNYMASLRGKTPTVQTVG